MEQIERGKMRILNATDGFVHKMGTEVYGRSVVMLPDETAEMYEEVMERPAYSREAYAMRVAALIRARYSQEDETSLINNMLEEEPSAEHVAEYREYQAFRAECKRKAREMKDFTFDENF